MSPVFEIRWLRFKANKRGYVSLWLFSLLFFVSLFAELIAISSNIPLAQAFLAFSPGGLTEMSLLTLAMGQDVTYVSVMHIIRITLVIAIAPTVFKLARSWF